MPDLNEWMPWIDPEWMWVLRVFVVVLITAFGSFFRAPIAQQDVHACRIDRVSLGRHPVQFVETPGHLVDLDRRSRSLRSTSFMPRLPERSVYLCSDDLRNVGVLLCIAWFFLGAIREVEQDFAGRDHFDKSTVLAIGKLTRLAVMVTAMLVILQTLGYSISGVLAMGGIGGIAIGFAAKDMLANFFGGLMIYLDRPFSEGDWIRSPDREIEGTVESIGWRITVIRNFESRPCTSRTRYFPASSSRIRRAWPTDASMKPSGCAMPIWTAWSALSTKCARC